MYVPVIRRFWVALTSGVILIYAACLNRLRIVGSENIPERGGVLLLSNHISAYDTVLLPAAVQKTWPCQMIWLPPRRSCFVIFFLVLFFAPGEPFRSSVAAMSEPEKIGRSVED